MASGPLRTCIGCRRCAPAGTLVRVGRLPDGSLTVERGVPGRGAWLCRDADTGAIRRECLEAAVKRDAFTRALRAPVGRLPDTPGNSTRTERENM